MNVTNSLAISVFSSLAIILGIVLLVPRRTRPDIFFSVTLNPSFRESEAGRKILRSFSREAVLWTGAAALTAALMFWGWPAPVFVLLAVVLQIAGVTMAHARARRKVLAHRVAPSGEREAQLTPNNTRPVGGWLGQLGPFFVLAALAGAVILKWPEIPARFPIHWGMDGNPNGWADKSWGSVFLMPMIGTAACVLMGVMSLSLQRGVRHVHASGVDRANESAFLRRMLKVVLGLEYYLAAIFGGAAFLPLMTSPNHSTFHAGMFASIFFPLLAIIATVIIAARSGQGGSYLSGARRPGAAPVGDRTRDECWIGGMFYNNPNDPALFVEKRFGIGWTLNFGHRRAWLLMGGLFLFAAACVIVPIVVLK